jgi:4-hydroxy-3-methylbut-2-en-1-yl diphosphate synthase IspG/GcpE
VEVSEVAQHVDALVVDVADPIQSDRWHQLAGTRRPVFLEVECDSIGAVPQALGALRRAVEEAERFGVRDLCFSVRSQDEGALVRVGRAIRGAYPDGAPPIWIRHLSAEDPEGVMLGASIAIGTNLCDGIGDAVSIGGAEVLGDGARTRLAYDVLQGASARISKTEYVACPSCGRTLFDLQETTTRIQARTSHLKGVKLAIMGCIVNGPGEMADADFGYVGGAPGKVNLYVGRECVEKGVLQSEADDRLIELIKRHGRWIDDPKLASASSNRSSR